MAADKTYTASMTGKQIDALVESAKNTLVRLDDEKYRVGGEGATYDDRRMIDIRMKERLLRNAIERLENAKGGS